MKSEFLTAFNQICADRNLPQDVVLEAIKTALVSAYRRNANAPAGQNITADIDPETGEASIYVEQQVVDEVADPQSEIPLQKARKLEPEVELGEHLLVERTPRNFGRIAAQTARQVILQRIREAEREAQFSHYVEQEGELVYGTVQNVNSQFVTLQLGRTEAVMPRKEQVPGERYSMHDRIRAYVLEVRRTTRGPHIIVSRSHKRMLRRLLELEVPEIANGTVEIKAIAREAGSRSKIAVAALQTGVDPVGACVGMRGMRIQSIVKELGGEKVDVIEWSEDPVTFIAKSLSPARVLSVQLDEDPDEGRTANVVVPDDQLSLAIGRAGQNARLAAKLTNWRIDIQGATEAIEWVLKKVNEDHALLEALGPTTERLPTVAAALRHHKEQRMPYTAEELMAIREAIEGVRGYYISLRDAERARLVKQEAARKAALTEARTARQAAIQEARSRIAPTAYEVSLSDIELSNRVLGHLERAGLENVGQVLEHMAEGDEGLLKLDGIGPKSMGEIQDALDKLELPTEEAVEVAVEEVEAAAEEVVEVPEEIEAAVAVEEPVEAVEVAEAEEIAAVEEHEPAAVAEEVEAQVEETVAEVLEEPVQEPAEEAVEHTAEEVLTEEPVDEELVAEQAPAVVEEALEEEISEIEEEISDEAQAGEKEEEEIPEDWEKFVEEEGEEEEEEGEELLDSKARRRKRRRRKLVYDEELGEVISIRKHWRDEEEDWEQFIP